MSYFAAIENSIVISNHLEYAGIGHWNQFAISHKQADSITFGISSEVSKTVGDQCSKLLNDCKISKFNEKNFSKNSNLPSNMQTILKALNLWLTLLNIAALQFHPYFLFDKFISYKN